MHDLFKRIFYKSYAGCITTDKGGVVYDGDGGVLLQGLS